MDKKLKAKWLKALRSGKFKQGLGYLLSIEDEEDPSQDRYCCLGVLAVVDGVAREELSNKEHLGSVRRSCLLGPWTKRGTDPCFDPEDETTHTTVQRTLAAMNDDKKSFKQIANWISRNL